MSESVWLVWSWGHDLEAVCATEEAAEEWIRVYAGTEVVDPDGRRWHHAEASECEIREHPLFRFGRVDGATGEQTE